MLSNRYINYLRLYLIYSILHGVLLRFINKLAYLVNPFISLDLRISVLNG